MVKTISMDLLIYWNEFKDGNYNNIETLQTEFEQISKAKDISINTRVWVTRNLKKIRKAINREKYKGLSAAEIFRKTVKNMNIDYEWFMRNYGFTINYNGNIYNHNSLYIHKDLSGEAVEKKIKGFIKQFKVVYIYNKRKFEIEIENRRRREENLKKDIIKKSKNWIEGLVFVDDFKFESFNIKNSKDGNNDKLNAKFEFTGYMIHYRSKIVKVYIKAEYNKCYKEKFNILSVYAVDNDDHKIKIDIETKF